MNQFSLPILGLRRGRLACPELSQPFGHQYARSKRGNTYLTVFWITAILGLMLGGFLKMVANQNAFTMRSQAWNQSIVVVEAGIEEALAHLNKNGTTNQN